jgi:hypothetical protein
MQRLAKGSEHQQVFCDPSLDASGWTPQALRQLIDLGSRLAYDEAARVASNFGLGISGVELWRTISPYAQACRQGVDETLAAQAFEPLSEGSARVMVLQLDGVMVLGHVDEQPDAEASYETAPSEETEPLEAESAESERLDKKRCCPGMEVKSVVLYPQQSPSERYMLADIRRSNELLPRVSGLLRVAGVRQQDTLVGLGDGADWIAKHFEHLGAIPIIDVYHSCGYLEKLMKALNWSASKRAYHRQQWFQGKVAARNWLDRHLPDDPEVWFAWPKEAQEALRYLEQRKDAMDYPDYLAKGYPIGSGQVEGMNKSVIGNRLKRSGMQWSQPGAAHMASLRAQTCAKHSLIDFGTLRHKAYPVLQS